MPDHTTLRTGLRLAGCFAAVALVSACATGPKISAQQESSHYRAHARNYTPPGPPSDPWGPYIHEAAARFDVPDVWIREVMHQESGGNLYHGGSLVTSGAGAMGLMQVMPATYDDIRLRYPELSDDPYDPHNNILAGTAYIREMYDIYGSPGFLAAYNAGPGRLDDYLTRNRTLPEETRRYVAAIGPRIAGAAPRTASPGQQFAMNAVPFSIPDGPRYASRYSAPTGGPIVLSPAPSFASAQPVAPVQIAAAAPSSAYIVLRPQRVQSAPLAAPAPAPVEVAEAEPLPMPIVVPTPGPEYRDPGPQPMQTAEAVPEPPRYAPAPMPTRPDPMQFAQLPEPPRPAPLPYTPAPYTPAPYTPYREPARSQQQLAAAALVPVAPRGGFNLISPANAEPIGIHHSGGERGNWAVQVGAFANEGLAASATFTAREHAHEVLASAHTSVTPVHQPHGVLYRARLIGLSRDAASTACEKLVRARTSCMVVSPDAQS